MLFFKNIISIKIKLVLILFFLSTSVAFSQKNLSKANRYYDLNMFVDAIPLYLLASKEGNKESKELALVRLANCYRITGEFELAEKTYKTIVKNKKTAPVNFLNYGLALKGSSKYEEAAEIFKKYKQVNPSDKMADVYVKSCEIAQHWLDEPVTMDVKNIQSANSAVPDFSSTYFDKGIIFSSSREGSKKKIISFKGGTEEAALDFYYLDLSLPADSAVLPKPLVGLNTFLHEGPASFDKEQKTVYFTRMITGSRDKQTNTILKTLHIMMSRKDTAGKWIPAVSAFPFNSSAYSIGHPSLSSDGKRLYFMSDMPGGLGGTDIYYSELSSDSIWGNPVNLGDSINTFGNELYPFIHNNKTLYFSSNTHPGMGGLDIFYSTLKDTSWSLPINLKPPINTLGDDFSYVRDPLFNRGFLSSDRFNGLGLDDIYSFVETAPLNITLNGQQLELDDQTFYDGIIFKVFNESTQEETPLLSKSGKYKMVLEENVQYTLSARKNGFKYDKVGIKYQRNLRNNHLDLVITPQEKNVKINGFLYEFSKVDSLGHVSGNTISNANVILKEDEGQIAKMISSSMGAFSFNHELEPKKTYKVISQKEVNSNSNQTILFNGKVLSSDKLLKNALVKLFNNNRLQEDLKSDMDGNFSFNLSQESANYKLFVTKNGYDNFETEFSTSGYTVNDTIKKDIELKAKPLVPLKGIVKSKGEFVSNAQVALYADVSQIKTRVTDDTGHFSFSLLNDASYAISISKKGYFIKKVDVSFEETNQAGELILDIELDSLKLNQVITFNVFYEPNKADVSKSSVKELDKLISFLQSNPNVSIEVSAHTDSKGNEQYNLKLSQDRANMVALYLYFEGGIEKKRVISKGYGESKPIIIDAKTEEEHNKNRRTEIKVLQY